MASEAFTLVNARCVMRDLADVLGDTPAVSHGWTQRWLDRPTPAAGSPGVVDHVELALLIARGAARASHRMPLGTGDRVRSLVAELHRRIGDLRRDD